MNETWRRVSSFLTHVVLDEATTRGSLPETHGGSWLVLRREPYVGNAWGLGECTEGVLDATQEHAAFDHSHNGLAMRN